MSQTDKTRVRLALIVICFVAVVLPAIASAQADGHPKTSTSSRADSSAPSPLPPGAYSPRTFWDGGEGAHLAYVASLNVARARSRGAQPERARARPAGSVAPVGGATASSGQPDWYSIAACESGGRWDINSGNGYWGGLQFAPSTWFAYGGGPFDGTGPFPYSAGEQIAVATRVFSAQGPNAWPSCFQWK
jgi:hypothetical protein